MMLCSLTSQHRAFVSTLSTGRSCFKRTLSSSLQSRSNIGDWPLCFSLSAELSIDWLSISGPIPVHAGSPHRSSDRRSNHSHYQSPSVSAGVVGLNTNPPFRYTPTALRHARHGGNIYLALFPCIFRHGPRSRKVI